ncbi:MAG: ASKHA domain-containing protein [candidate division WOR-3 bacterium]|jgi:uncharacterized 2Fe-2S/4Fe-4S cluster protein (DUF4445 family)
MLIKILPRKKHTLRELLIDRGVVLAGECGGQGKCGQCRVKVNNRLVLACQFIPDAPVMVELEENPAPASARISTCRRRNLVLAADIGTTTITLAAVDPEQGRAVRTTTQLNPQARLGADVISRIAQAARVRKIRLTALLEQFIQEAGIDPRRVVTAVGNTVMMHFLFNQSPAGLGSYPYRSRLPLKQVLTSRIDRLRLRTLPLLGSFIGSDCTAAIIASGIYRHKQPALLIDAGTNGELILGNRDRLLVCSTAAGPAFEGATLECGSLFQPGAVVAAEYKTGRWQLKTAGRLKPKSICGSGVLDVVASGLKAGLILPSGRLAAGNRLTIYEDHGRALYLSQADLRQVQLAKAAIAAGIRILLKRWFGTEQQFNRIDRLIITGRFGNRINPESAFTIGILPRVRFAIIRQHPNLALAGAIKAVTNPEIVPLARTIARRCEEVVLSEQPEFESLFVSGMELKRWE